MSTELKALISLTDKKRHLRKAEPLVQVQINRARNLTVIGVYHNISYTIIVVKQHWYTMLISVSVFHSLTNR